jgi:hypothetical protein
MDSVTRRQVPADRLMAHPMPTGPGLARAAAGREASQWGVSLGPLRQGHRAARVLPRGVREGRGPGRDPGGATLSRPAFHSPLNDESGQEQLSSRFVVGLIILVFGSPCTGRPASPARRSSRDRW